MLQPRPARRASSTHGCRTSHAPRDPRQEPRSHAGGTRTDTVSELSLLSGCAESVIDACVQELLGCGLIAEDGESSHDSGPAGPYLLPDSGTVLVAELGASRTSVGAPTSRTADRPAPAFPPTSPAGPNLPWPHRRASPEPTNRRPVRISRTDLGYQHRLARRGGLGVRVGPWATPLLAGWGDYPVREWLAEKLTFPSGWTTT